MTKFREESIEVDYVLFINDAQGCLTGVCGRHKKADSDSYNKSNINRRTLFIGLVPPYSGSIHRQQREAAGVTGSILSLRAEPFNPMTTGNKQ